MQFVDVHQPIEMIAWFTGAKLRPLRFRWKGEVYRVRRVNGSWINESGRVRNVYYSVQSDQPDTYELCFNSRDLQWMITRIGVDG